MDVLSFYSRRSPRREAPRTLRERLECSEGGNTGRRTRKGPTERLSGSAVRSAPGRGRAESRAYTPSSGKRKRASFRAWLRPKSAFAVPSATGREERRGFVAGAFAGRPDRCEHATGRRRLP